MAVAYGNFNRQYGYNFRGIKGIVPYSQYPRPNSSPQHNAVEF